MNTKSLVLAGVILVMASCSDTVGIRCIKGGYRYKTTGQVTLKENYTGATSADTIRLNLNNESGDLDIISLHDEDSLLITLDQQNGNVCSTRGILDGNTIHFAPYTRTLSIPTETTKYDTFRIGIFPFQRDSIVSYQIHKTEVFDITVSGYGQTFDNTLLFYLNYKGRSQSSERTLSGTGIRMQAKKY